MAFASAGAAGRMFRPICQEACPDVASAQRRSVGAGLKFNARSGLDEEASRDIGMGINEEKCALRFLTNTSRTETLVDFASASSSVDRAPDLSGHSNVKIGTEEAGPGLTRLAATRWSDNRKTP